LDRAHDREYEWEADNPSEIVPENSVKETETPDQWNVCARPNVPGLFRPTQMLKINIEKVFIMLNPMEMRRNKGNKKMQDRMGQSILTRFII
jgi:hypothetical protein